MARVMEPAGTARRTRPAGTAWRIGARLASAVLPALVAVIVLLAGPTPAAQAHAQGAPQKVGLSLAAPNVVRAHWEVGSADDLSWLALDAGLLPSDRLLLDGGILPKGSDANLLERSAGFDRYLLSHITVRAEGSSCRGALAGKSDVATSGATLLYTCPRTVTSATVSVRLLTDLDPQYATVVSGQDGKSVVYTAAADTLSWHFDSADVRREPATAGGAGPAGFPTHAVLVAGGVALPAALGGAVWWWRRRRGRGRAVASRAVVDGAE